MVTVTGGNALGGVGGTLVSGAYLLVRAIALQGTSRKWQA
jgi:hypothetical protein